VKRDNLPRQNTPLVDYESVCRAFKPRIVGLCRSLLRDADEAEDVTQEVFLRAYERLSTDGAPDVWEAWLVRVAVNGCRDRQRSAWWKRFRRIESQQADRNLELFPSSEEEAIAREQRSRIWRQLQTLRDRQRQVFVLRCIEEWSTEEVAGQLGLTTGTVKRHLFRAVRKLRKVVER